ncbi:hypothetical protein GGR42_003257 [Saonia flava]|uniref:Uncharacterized protein n=1 Tax=Saonia flava TaxID=523696 RepID=A0A846QV04_9FLAO|nr:hypothetical protein [Saonia flava]NJB72766.1 hypothetical protein [Saonia flava]
MKKHIFYIFLGVFLLFMTSCMEEQNFDQIDDLSITPTIESSIIYVESPERLINLASGISFYTAAFNFDAFSQAYFAERVLDGSITYELENTTSKEMEILFEFLDEGGNSLDSEQFFLEPESTAVLQREVFYGGTGRSLDIIANTSSLSVSVRNLGNSTSISSIPSPKIVLRSSAKFRVRLK